MEAVVAVALILGFGVVVSENRPQTFVFAVLGGESDDGGSASCDGAPGTASPAIAGGRVGLGEVDMAVYALVSSSE